MEDIYTSYYNDFGIAFQCKRCTAKDMKKIQLVFRDTGLFLTKFELKQFDKQIETTLKGSLLCRDCINNEPCKSLLLQTPAAQINFAMSYLELKKTQDLVKGTLAQLDYIFKVNAIRKA